MRDRWKLVLVLMMGTAFAGCGGQKAVDQSASVDAAGASAAGLGAEGGAAGSALFGEGDPLSKRVIYFEYDSSNVDEESRAVIEAHASQLSGNSGANVVLEGHADERGTREYNLALGERRAKAVSRLMQAYGITPERIQTISYGEERPASIGHDDSAWSLNRRVEILY